MCFLFDLCSPFLVSHQKPAKHRICTKNNEENKVCQNTAQKLFSVVRRRVNACNYVKLHTTCQTMTKTAKIVNETCEYKSAHGRPTPLHSFSERISEQSTIFKTWDFFSFSEILRNERVRKFGFRSSDSRYFRKRSSESAFILALLSEYFSEFEKTGVVVFPILEFIVFTDTGRFAPPKYNARVWCCTCCCFALRFLWNSLSAQWFLHRSPNKLGSLARATSSLTEGPV